MGMDLHRRDGTDWSGAEAYHVNVSGWSWLFRAGREYGWEPAGTEEPADWGRRPRRPWDGGYGTNDVQYVTPADAAAWADALARGRPFRGEPPRWRGMVEEFIAYCRGGGFEIH